MKKADSTSDKVEMKGKEQKTRVVHSLEIFYSGQKGFGMRTVRTLFGYKLRKLRLFR